MPDASYDVVIIGGGNKGLITAMYLARYGGMSVGVFEKRHESGGGWSTDEGAAPGFLADYHASGISAAYHIPVEQAFPEWVKLGGKYIDVEVGTGAVFKEDDSSLVMYHRGIDRDQERTAKEIARFSERDAETWLRLYNASRSMIPALMEWLHNPPTAPDALEKLLLDPKLGFDPSWAMKSPLEVFMDVFESGAFINMAMRIV